GRAPPPLPPLLPLLPPLAFPREGLPPGVLRLLVVLDLRLRPAVVVLVPRGKRPGCSGGGSDRRAHRRDLRGVDDRVERLPVRLARRHLGHSRTSSASSRASASSSIASYSSTVRCPSSSYRSATSSLRPRS